MNTDSLFPVILLLLSSVTLSQSKCSDFLNPDNSLLKGDVGDVTKDCDIDGNYKLEQCDFSPAQFRCWCVDRITGVEISGTSVPAGLFDNLDCASVQPGGAVDGASTTKSPTLTTPSTTEDIQLNFDENDMCYQQNKKTYDYWSQKVKNYEEQVQKWQSSMKEYEEYLNSLKSDQT